MAQLRTKGLDLKVLEDRQVMLHFGDKPEIDIKTGAFGAGWHAAGLELADGSHGHTREVSSNTTNMTGGQTATSYTPGAISGTFGVIKGSPAAEYIENPEKIYKDGVGIGGHSAKVAKAYVAFVQKFQSGIVRIWVSREKADLTISETTTSTDPQEMAVSIAFQNGDDEYYFEERFYIVGKDGAVAAVAPKIFTNIEDLEKKIEEGKAFHPSASAEGLTALVPTKVDAGAATLHEFADQKSGEDGLVPAPAPAPVTP